MKKLSKAKIECLTKRLIWQHGVGGEKSLESGVTRPDGEKYARRSKIY